MDRKRSDESNADRQTTATRRDVVRGGAAVTLGSLSGAIRSSPTVAHQGGTGRFDHVVVIMFENRSFDNLFGYLYEPGEKPSFEGVAGRELSNPIPADAPGADRKVVAVHPAKNMDTPNPDPGEEYPHINTQLFGTVAPDANRFAAVGKMAAPFNLPPARRPRRRWTGSSPTTSISSATPWAACRSTTSTPRSWPATRPSNCL